MGSSSQNRGENKINVWKTTTQPVSFFARIPYLFRTFKASILVRAIAA